MKIWHSEKEFDLDASVAALGMFDGLHIGHQALIFRARDMAREMDAACVVCTFDRHPLSVIRPENAPAQLLTNAEKLEKLEKLGVDGVLLQAFTPEFAAVEPMRFLEGLVKNLRVKGIVAGFNYSFGAKGRGNARMIMEEADRLGYRAAILDAVRDGGDTVSSTLIRELIGKGDLVRAEQLLRLANG